MNNNDDSLPDLRGLLLKYCRIERTDGSHEPGRKHHGCDYFVLDLTHDKHAKAALAAYANDAEVERPALAADLRAKYSLTPISNDEKLIRDLLDAIKAKDDLLACYRINRQPSEALWKRLAKAADTIHAAETRIKDLK